MRKIVKQFPIIIKTEENVRENPSPYVPFSLETGKLNILKD